MLNYSMRATERIPAYQNIVYVSNNQKRYGTITNCSEKGMHLNTMISFPLDLIHEILIPFNDEEIKATVKVVRLEKRGGSYEGMGVEVLNVRGNYSKLLLDLNLSSYLQAV